MGLYPSLAASQITLAPLVCSSCKSASLSSGQRIFYNFQLYVVANTGVPGNKVLTAASS